eukprot:TRINITY_DN1204_c1_g4_i1.p1 TRINITY_DN1204_c1_g4~~TRINITY_DN1204_c1_g4_i1.p1  ORF type:complete len:1087 (+),score=453.83 TRINITY_DN1204_c1_g4_i1:186-3446(+)
MIMDAVKSFNQELSSLYEIKPPISKAKMTSITKGAIKAIKFYKHVVQSVEKFIQKCRPEYKIPGLYVIDSIVRQSRHQFGAEKDVFAPRFAKNINVTFWHLYHCAEEEKSKVIRVLNLWQKNAVFSSELVQPLFDLANPNSEMSRSVEEALKRGSEKKSVGGPPGAITLVAPESIISSSSSASAAALSAASSPPSGPLDQQVIQQLQTIQHLLKNHSSMNHSSSNDVKFNKKVLDDFDYSDEEDGGGHEGEASLNVPPPAMIEALQGILGNERVLSQLKSMGAISNSQILQLQQLLSSSGSHHFSSPNAATPSAPSAPNSCMPPPPPLHSWNTPKGGPPSNNNSNSSSSQPVINLDLEEGERAETDEDIQIVEDRSSYRSRSRDRSKRRRSRSRSPGRSRKSRRSRSRSRDRSGRRRERDEEREKRKEREKKGLPPIKKDHLSVCSTTLWVGHLSRLVAEDHLSDIFGEYGEIVSIDLIPPRGCAFVCMNRRMDAAKALKSLYKYKINNKPIILAWAPGKGMKDKQWKDYWDVDLGVSYIPINKLDPQVNMADLEEGGMFDEDTMPEWMKTMRGVALASPAAAASVANVPPAQPPQFIPVPEGLPPPVLDPGLSFGMPLPPPPPNVLFGRPPPPIPGPFNAAQPPPGLRLPFPPPVPPMMPPENNAAAPPPTVAASAGNSEEEPIHVPKDEDLASRLRSLAGGMEGPPPTNEALMMQHESPINSNNNEGPPEGSGDYGGDPSMMHHSNGGGGGRFNNEFMGGPPDSPFMHRPRGRFPPPGGPRGGGWGGGPFDGRGSFRGRGGRRGRGNHHPGDRWMEHERFDGGFPPQNMPPWAGGGHEGPWSGGEGWNERRGRGGRFPIRGGGGGGGNRGFDFHNNRFGGEDFDERGRDNGGESSFHEEGGEDNMMMSTEEDDGQQQQPMNEMITGAEEENSHSAPPPPPPSSEQPQQTSSREERRKARKSRWSEKETPPIQEMKPDDTTIEQEEPQQTMIPRMEGGEKEAAAKDFNSSSNNINESAHGDEGVQSSDVLPHSANERRADDHENRSINGVEGECEAAMQLSEEAPNHHEEAQEQPTDSTFESPAS